MQAYAEGIPIYNLSIWKNENQTNNLPWKLLHLILLKIIFYDSLLEL